MTEIPITKDVLEKLQRMNPEQARYYLQGLTVQREPTPDYSSMTVDQLRERYNELALKGYKTVAETREVYAIDKALKGKLQEAAAEKAQQVDIATARQLVTKHKDNIPQLQDKLNKLVNLNFRTPAQNKEILALQKQLAEAYSEFNSVSPEARQQALDELDQQTKPAPQERTPQQIVWDALKGQGYSDAEISEAMKEQGL